MLAYKIIFFLHIFIIKLFKIDIRSRVIKHVYTSGIKSISNKKNIENNFKSTLEEASKEYYKNNDKRALWEHHRLDFLNDELISFKSRKDKLFFWLYFSTKFEYIIFENMMESSLRGSNILRFFNANEALFSNQDKNLIKKYLKKTYLLNILCPDMYFRRSGLYLFDESNNHFIFCMCYQIIYLNFQKKLSFAYLRKVLNYFEHKHSDDGFLMEGSTFYAYSVSDAILKTLFFINKEIQLTDFQKLHKAFISMNSTELDLKNVNFGDKDGTILLPSLDTNADFKDYIFNLIGKSDKYFLENNIHIIKSGRLKIVINGRNVYQFGTLGHYHDDYGHFNLYKDNKSVIIDPGTKSYSVKNERFDENRYHNGPFIKNKASLKKKRNFEKTFDSKISKNIKDEKISIIKVDSYGRWLRQVGSKNFCIQDIFQFNKEAFIRVYFLKEPQIIKNEDKVKVFKIDNVALEISCNELFNYNTCKDEYAPNYNQAKDAYILEMNFKKDKKHILNWEFSCTN